MSGEATIELVYWRECPSWPGALADLRSAMLDAGLDPDTVDVREVETEQDAQREGFVGSPTIRIGGRDIQPAAEDEPLGLTCRIYRLRDGRVSPTPDPADVREALDAVAAAR